MKTTIKQYQININPRNTRKSGSGRVKGSYSFVRVNAAELLDFVGPNASIVVSRKWAQGVGMTMPVSAPANVIRNQHLRA